MLLSLKAAVSAAISKTSRNLTENFNDSEWNRVEHRPTSDIAPSFEPSDTDASQADEHENNSLLEHEENILLSPSAGESIFLPDVTIS